MHDADRAALVRADPVELVRRQTRRDDQEVIGLIVAMLAYGRVTSIKAAAERVLTALGPRPAERVDARQTDALRGFVYRFQKADDLVRFLAAIARVRQTFGSLAACFAEGVDPDRPRYDLAMARFTQHLRSAVDGPLTYGLRFLLPDVAGGGAAKRLCLYLRWMIRPEDGMDLGTWPSLDPAKLIIPLDVHIFALGGFLGFTQRKTANLKAAMEITEALAQLSPKDPLVYDMALCHLGISGQCQKRYVRAVCEACPIRGICQLVQST